MPHTDEGRKQSTDEAVRIRIFGHVLRIGTYTIALACISVAGWLWKGQTDQNTQIADTKSQIHDTKDDILLIKEEIGYLRQDQRYFMRMQGVTPTTPPPSTQPGGRP